MKSAIIGLLILLALPTHAQSHGSTTSALDQGDRAARAGEAAANKFVMSEENQIPQTPTFEDRVRQKARDLGARTGEAVQDRSDDKRNSGSGDDVPPSPMER